MGYTLHIKRKETISLSEWREAISSVKGVKIDNSDYEAVNPKTGAVIKIGSYEGGDAVVLFETSGFLGFGKKAIWEKCISFSNGVASFKATDDIEKSSNPVHVVVKNLSSLLSAQIIGDEGEEYKW